MEQLVVDHGLVERVGADQHGRDVPLDDAERMQAALHGRGFPVADHAVGRGDAHERGAAARRVARRPTDLEGLDRLDFRGCGQRLASSIGLEGAAAAEARARSAMMRPRRAEWRDARRAGPPDGAQPCGSARLAGLLVAGNPLSTPAATGRRSGLSSRFTPQRGSRPASDFGPLWLLAQRYANCIRMQHDSPCIRVITPMRRWTCARTGRQLPHRRRS